MNHPQHDKRTIAAWSSDPAPLIVGKDVLLLGYLPVMTLIAWGAPERYWPGLCRRLAWITTRLRARRTARQHQEVMRLLGLDRLDRKVEHIVRLHVANHHLARLQGLRWHGVGGWRPRIEITGCEHVERALVAGKGAVLWVAPLAFSDIVTKMAFRQAGFRVSHLSRIEHGISRSRLGARLFNPIWTAVERDHLAERLVMAPGQSAGALRELVRRLRENRLVSIAIGGQGLRTHSAAFLRGTIHIADGAPSLAQRTGAQLLPVFTVRMDDGSFVTTIEPPLPVLPEIARDETVRMLVAKCAAALAAYVLRWPEQYQSWDPSSG